jgi:hypothetical protein
MSKKFLEILLATSLLWFPSLEAHCEAVNDLNTPTKAAPRQGTSPLLQGGVRHKEFVQPVEPGLRAGAKFDEQALLPLTPGNIWIPIPPWLAGKWQFKTENVTQMQNYTDKSYTQPPYTIRNESQRIFGQQKDKTGQIWHYLRAPYGYTAKLDHGWLGHERVLSVEPVAVTDTEVNLILTGTDTTVNPKTQLVVYTDQSEDFNHYTQLGKDEMVNNGSAKHFDMNGKPTMVLTSYMKARRIKPFAVIDEQDGEHLKLLFSEFMKSHGKADLLND